MIQQTPGVYITEKNTIPASIAGVSTAIPIFIGYTEKTIADAQGNPKPMLIQSLFEFKNIYGTAYEPTFSINFDNNNHLESVQPDKRFFLYDTLQLYFKNGGGPCYIISDPNHTFTDVTNTHFQTFFSNAIHSVDSIEEATLVLIPDLHFQYTDSNGTLVSIDETAVYQNSVNHLLNTCAEKKEKIAILDFHKPTSKLDDMRAIITPNVNALQFGAAYYPWLRKVEKHLVNFDAIANYTPAVSANIRDISDDLTLLNNDFAQGNTFVDLNIQYQHLNSVFREATNKTNFTAIFRYLFDVIKSLETIDSTANSTEFTNEINRLLGNTNFIYQVQRLLRVIKILNTNNHGSTSTKFIGITGYPPVTGSPTLTIAEKWFNPVGASQTISFADMVEEVTLQGEDYSATTIIGDVNTANNKTRDVFLDELNAGAYVDIQFIFDAVRQIMESLTVKKQHLANQLFATDATYSNIQNAIQEYMQEIPSQGAITGIYCKNDRERGVWKSPANAALQGIAGPMISISDRTQEAFNVDANTGKSVNAIRTFAGKGTLVWGARTLDGNSNEWRYIAVRRFFSFAETSIKRALNDFVFQPNNTKTWVQIKAMIHNFLVQQWRAGALLGNTKDEAFFVRVGQETTSIEEILEGKINVQIGMAVNRPAEFIILAFSHKSITQ